MSLTESDLSELLAALHAGEFTDRIRTGLEWVLRQLIEAEATANLAPVRTERRTDRSAQRASPPPVVDSGW